ncbi:DUF4347 domain-containing protein [Pseudanabaena minima]|uniref:DUF4347 domain-containing protein n=1 Tax=Pseudanabaena minima TaxID=890415 RepID=UPI003DA9CF6E
MKSVLGIFWTTAIALYPALLTTAPINAQTLPITAAPDGTDTIVLPNGQRFDITGGTQAGGNLFHSFQQFGLHQGQIANFLSQPNIQNILGRVVGGDPSMINGLVQLTGGNSNLYIMNPAGVIFGANASLNVPASFTATTAIGIQVGNSWFGMNTSATDLKNLTGTPNAFAFTSPTTPLTQGQTSGVILNQGNLNVLEGKSISLVGGIVINTGAIATDNGTINIVAVPDSKYVRITPEDGVLSFDLPIATQQELGNTKPMAGIDLPKLLTGTGITAPTNSGEAIATGSLTAANINILANRYNTTQASLNATNIQQGWNFVFIDSTVKDYQTLLDGTNGGSSVTVINPDQYGIQKVTETLASVTGANSLHIVSEGDVGNFWLGKDFVSTENIAKYANDLQAWKTSLSPAANILLYACNLASGENGATLVQAVKYYTGLDVAASTDITGSSNLGGNWNLEYQTGKINSGVVFSSQAQHSFNSRLVTFTTTNINDSGAGSLRQAILDANALAGADDIRFDPTGIFATPQIINLTSGTIDISQDLTVQGTGASNLTISGNNTFRIFNITAGNVTFDGLTITNGRGVTGGGISNNGVGTLTVSNSNVSGNSVTNSGGGLFTNTGNLTVINSTVSNNTSNADGGGIVSRGGALTITNSTVSNNRSLNSGGGGIVSDGTTLTLTNSTVSGNTTCLVAGCVAGGIYIGNNGTISNSTISGNSSFGDGGGIFSNGGVVTITNSTITNNISDSLNNDSGNGGGIFAFPGNLTISNSIVAGNFDSPNNAGLGTINPDVSGSFIDGGNNLIGDSTGSVNFTISTLVGTAANRLNPQLAPLANNGGPTQTHALLTGSPALDAGNNALIPVAVNTDQRGLLRIFGGIVDIGAFEFQIPPPVPVPAPASIPTSTSTPISRGGFGGVYPSRKDLEAWNSKLGKQTDVSFTQVLCLDPSLVTSQTTSIPICQNLEPN